MSLVIPLGLASAHTSSPVAGESEVSSPGSDEGLQIYLKYAAFDPLQSRPAVPDHLRTSQGSRLALVQLVGPTLPDWYQTLEAQGLTLLRYIPDYAYLVFEAQPGGLAEAEGLDFVRWVGPYHPAYKVSPELAAVTGAVEIEVEVKLFPELTTSKDQQTIMEAIKGLGGGVIDEGWINKIITARLITSELPALTNLDRVEWLDLHGQKETAMDNIRVFTGTDEMHSFNFSGQPIVGEIKDNGIDQDHPEFEGQIIGLDGNVDEADHGTSTFGIVFAIGVDERALGQSNGSGGVFCDWGVGRYQSIRNLVNNWGGLFQSNSWHQGSANSQYSAYSEENDRAVFDFDVSMLYAAGNGGDDESISQEATAKNVIAVGGLSHYDNTDREDDRHTGSQGNKGPTEDGRIKPDLSGPYDAIYTTDGGGGYTSSFGGTSGATPVMAGALSLAYQLYMANHFGNNPSGAAPHAATIKALAIADAYQHDLDRADRFAQGWGYIDMDYMYDMGVRHLIIDEEVALETGEDITVNFQPTTLTPLKISLVWTDVPGTTSSSRHLINDLDLRVTSPSGEVYWGNYGLVDNLYSLSDGSRDNLNNVENVFVEVPEEGIWKLQVIADNVAQDGDTATEEWDQPFSVVASGVIREEHELALSSLTTERYFEPEVTTPIGVQASNIGLSDEENLTVELRVGGELIASEPLAMLASGTTQILTLDWTPPAEGLFTLSVHLLPLETEARTYNNWVNRTVEVFKPVGKVLVDGAHNNDFAHTVLQGELEAAHYQVYTLEEGTNLTGGVLEPYTLFVIGQAQAAYSGEEVTALTAFVDSGGGLLVAGDADADLYDPLTDYAGVDWTDQPALFGTTNEIEDHPITDNVTQLDFNSPNVILEVSGSAQEVVWDETPLFPNLLAAAGPYGEGRVVALADINVIDDDNLNASENLRFAMNIFGWINNQVPVAIIDTPTEGLYPAGAAIAFDGSSSFDPEGQPLTYLWESDRDGEFGDQASFSETLFERGPHTLTLTVSDGFKSATASVEIVLNTAPEARILTPLDRAMALPGAELTFSAEDDLDPDGDQVDYLWESSLDGELSREASFTISNLSLGEHTLTLTVTDPYGAVSSASIILYINTPPTAVISEPYAGQVFRPTQPVTFAAEGSYDAETPDQLTYQWYSDLEGELSNQASFRTRLTAGVHHLTLTVDDGQLGTDTAEVVVTVNTPPWPTLWALENTADETVELAWSVQDPEGGPFDISLYLIEAGQTPVQIAQGLALDDTYLWSTAQLAEGPVTFRLTVDDGIDSASTDSGAVTIYHAALHPDYYILDQALQVSSPAPEIVEGEEVILTFTVVNPSTVEARSITVAIYMDDPSLGENLLYTETLTLPPGGQQEVSFPWTAVVGNHLLYARIEFEDEDTNNNVALEPVSIAARPPPAVEEGGQNQILLLILGAAVALGGGGGLAHYLRQRSPSRSRLHPGPLPHQGPAAAEQGWPPLAQPGVAAAPGTAYPAAPLGPAATAAAATTPAAAAAAPAAPMTMPAADCPTCWEPAPFQPAYGCWYCESCDQWLAAAQGG